MEDEKKVDENLKKEDLEAEINETQQEATAEAKKPDDEDVKDNESSNEISDESAADEGVSDGEKALIKATEAAQKAVEDLKKHLQEKTDRLQRTMAEFDNFRKRSEKEKDARFGMGERNVIEKILPVIDNFERGLGSLDDAAKEDPFVKGMDQVYKQLIGALADMGVKEIPALGEKFDPDLHNAVMHVEDENYGENEVCEVFSKGYSYKGTVVRFSMVKVAN